MSHTIRDKKALLTRVRRIAGQAAALEKALEQESECAAILQQIAAIRGAVNGLMRAPGGGGLHAPAAAAGPGGGFDGAALVSEVSEGAAARAAWRGRQLG